MNINILRSGQGCLLVFKDRTTLLLLEEISWWRLRVCACERVCGTEYSRSQWYNLNGLVGSGQVHIRISGFSRNVCKPLAPTTGAAGAPCDHCGWRWEGAALGGDQLADKSKEWSRSVYQLWAMLCWYKMVLTLFVIKRFGKKENLGHLLFEATISLVYNDRL